MTICKAQKTVNVLIAVFLIIAVLILGLMIVGFFNDYFFNPEGPFLLGLGILVLGYNRRRRSFPRVDLVLNLAALPFHLIMIYGAVSLVLLSGLARHLLASWEWPVDDMSSVIAYDSGAKAVLLSDLRRIQVYDRAGRFSHGWFIERFPSPVSLHKNNFGLSGEEETFLISRSRQLRLAVYNLQGDLIAERDWSVKAMGFPDSRASGYPEIFRLAWYKWPLASELVSLICLAAGLWGGVILGRLHRGFVRRQRALAQLPGGPNPAPGDGPVTGVRDYRRYQPTTRGQGPDC